MFNFNTRQIEAHLDASKGERESSIMSWFYKSILQHVQLTQHRDECSKGVDVERQGAGEESTDADQPQSIYEQAPRYYSEQRHSDLANLRTIFNCSCICWFTPNKLQSEGTGCGTLGKRCRDISILRTVDHTHKLELVVPIFRINLWEPARGAEVTFCACANPLTTSWLRAPCWPCLGLDYSGPVQSYTLMSDSSRKRPGKCISRLLL